MADEPDWVPPGVDTGRANAARVYDYLLGGSHNFLVDQDAGRAFTSLDPNARTFARANRAFLGRAVRFLAGTGIRQFLDIGSGIPTQGNVHEVAQQSDPAAWVVYADIDPVAIAHSKVILDGNDKGQKFITDVAWKDLDAEFLNAVSAWNAWAPSSGSQNDGTGTKPHAIALPALSDL